jgi:hypothetical protein
MAVHEDLKANYKYFLSEGKKATLEIQTELNMEDGEVGNVVAQVIVGAMAHSINATRSSNEIDLIDKKVLDTVSTTNVRNAQSLQDVSIKQAQRLLIDSQRTSEAEKSKLYKEQTNMQIATRIRQQGVIFGNAGKLVLSRTGDSIAEKNIILLEEQALKVEAETEQTTKQTILMEKQVFHNCLIQGMKQSAEYTLAIAQGGLVPDNKQHINFFVQNKALLHHAGATIASDGKVTIPNPNGTGVLELGTFDTNVDVKQITS